MAPDFRAPELDLWALPPEDRDEEPRLRDDADEGRRLDALAVLRLDALALLGLLREADALPREVEALPREVEALLREADDLLRDEDGLDPFEVLDPDFRLVWERELAWAIAPP